MRDIKFPVTDEEYLEILKKKRDKTHKRIYMDALDIPYTPNKKGRPSLDELRSRMRKNAEDRLKQENRDRMRKYNAEHSEDYEANRKALGIDVEKGTTTPTLNKRREG